MNSQHDGGEGVSPVTPADNPFAAAHAIPQPSSVVVRPTGVTVVGVLCVIIGFIFWGGWTLFRISLMAWGRQYLGKPSLDEFFGTQASLPDASIGQISTTRPPS